MRFKKVPNDNLIWLFKDSWLKYGCKSKKGILNLPTLLKKKGIPVVTPEKVLLKNEPVFPKWSPEVPDDVQFKPLPTIKDDPNYHEEGVYEFDADSKLLEGVKQALLLTKTQAFEGLPSLVKKLVGSVSVPDQDWMMQKIIMQSHKWEPTKAKLPRRVNPDLPIWKFKAERGIPDYKIATLTGHNIMKLCDILISKHPNLLETRRTVSDVQLSTYFNYLDAKHLSVKGNTDIVMFSSDPLEPFASEEIVDQSVQHVLPNIAPVAPTIDLKIQHVWNYDNIIGYKDGYKFKYPNTLFLCYDDKWSTSQHNARSLMYCFGYSVGLAKKMYGDNVKILPKPISIQCVQTNGINFDFTCFQLNNIDFSLPVKNMAWFDSDNVLFNKVIPKRSMLRHTRYEDYNPEVIQKILALYANGI